LLAIFAKKKISPTLELPAAATGADSEDATVVPGLLGTYMVMAKLIVSQQNDGDFGVLIITLDSCADIVGIAIRQLRIDQYNRNRLLV